jgi:hypothetical protein
MPPTEKIFVNGLISKEVPVTAPDWVLGKMSIQVDNLQKWLLENKGLADNGWINLSILRSKATNKRYIEVDQYKPKVADGSVPVDVIPKGMDDPFA